MLFCYAEMSLITSTRPTWGLVRSLEMDIPFGTRNVTYDLGNNGATGKMYRIVFLLNNSTRIVIKTPYGNTEEYDIGELVRQGSVLGAVISANSLETVTKDSEYGLTETAVVTLQIYAVCFLDDTAALSNTLLQARKEPNRYRGVSGQEEATITLVQTR